MKQLKRHLQIMNALWPPLSTKSKDPTDVFREFVKNLAQMQTLARAANPRSFTGNRAKKP